MLRLLPIVFLAGCQISPDADLPEHIPVRPQTLSDPRTLPAGVLSFEAGIDTEPFDAQAITTSLQLGLSATSEAYLELDPYVDLADGGNGQGDTRIGLRHRLREIGGGRPSFALQFEGKLPTAEEDEEIGTGKVDFAVAALAGRQWHKNHLWWGYELGWLGEPDGQGADLRHTLAMGGARRIQEGVGGFADVSWVHLHERDFHAGSFRVGGVIATGGQWAVDLGMAFGFGGDRSEEIVFLGVTNGGVANLWRPQPD